MVEGTKNRWAVISKPVRRFLNFRVCPGTDMSCKKKGMKKNNKKTTKAELSCAKSENDKEHSLTTQNSANDGHSNASARYANSVWKWYER